MSLRVVCLCLLLLALLAQPTAGLRNLLAKRDLLAKRMGGAPLMEEGRGVEAQELSRLGLQGETREPCQYEVPRGCQCDAGKVKCPAYLKGGHGFT